MFTYLLQQCPRQRAFKVHNRTEGEVVVIKLVGHIQFRHHLYAPSQKRVKSQATLISISLNNDFILRNCFGNHSIRTLHKGNELSCSMYKYSIWLGINHVKMQYFVKHVQNRGLPSSLPPDGFRWLRNSTGKKSKIQRN